MMRQLQQNIFLSLLVLLTCANTSWAQNADARFDYGGVTVTPIGSIAQDTHLLGLDFELKRGWKIYWHSGGLSAQPPRIEWDAPSKAMIASSRILWPYPKRLKILTVETLGYQGRVTLPVELVMRDTASPQELSGTLHYPVCDRVCIPAQKSFSVTLPAADGAALTKILKRVPVRLDNDNIDAQLFWARDGDRLVIDGTIHNQRLKDVLLSVDRQYLAAEAKTRGGVTRLHGENFVQLANFDSADDLPLLLTAKRGRQAVTLELIAHPASSASANTLEPLRASWQNAEFTMGFGWALAGLALLAGFLLNFMPCVLPVLSLKLLPSAPSQQNNLRQDSLFAGLGIIIGFVILALLLLAVQQSGFVGWGFQFQSPFFLSAMLWAMLLFLSVSLDWQALRLPAFLPAADWSEHPIAQKLTTGIVIVWLASACTAPIISTIVIAALGSSAGMMVVILTLLGVGMALPYLLLAAVPAASRHLPKTGRWNLGLKYAVAIGLGATALWFLWLLSFHFSYYWQTVIIALIAVSLPFAAWLRYRHRLPTRAPIFLCGLALLMMVTLWAADSVSSSSPAPAPDALTQELDFTDFAPETVPALLEANKIIIIDVTARWCITCKINDINVWSSKWGQEFLQNPDLVFMRGDWTLPDSKIENFLARYQHFAIPFAIVFTPHNPSGMVLPEFLRIRDVENALSIGKGESDAG